VLHIQHVRTVVVVSLALVHPLYGKAIDGREKDDITAALVRNTLCATCHPLLKRSIDYTKSMMTD